MVSVELLRKGKEMAQAGILREWRGWYVSGYGGVGGDGRWMRHRKARKGFSTNGNTELEQEREGSEPA